MVRERGGKKSFEQSLEDIKEKMKEKRNKRLASATAPNRGRSKIINKTSAGNARSVVLKGVQVNNKALAVALQGEKEKLRQACNVILQLKREQQALYLHLLLLKRKLKEQEALASAAKSEPANTSANPVDGCRRMQISPSLDEPLVYEAPAVCPDQAPEEAGQVEFDIQESLPRTVSVRRRRAESSTRRRRESKHFCGGNPNAPLEALIGEVLEEALTASPIHPTHSDNTTQSQAPQEIESEPADLIGSEEVQHSTPEPAPAKSTNQQQPRRKQAQQPRPKPEPAVRKPERGRKPDRAPLKKPWDNPKPRARSKSRDRSATRARAAPTPQGDKLNTSLGFNDTFDFDCEEAVHLTPFKTKADDNQPAPPTQEEAPPTQEEAPQKGRTPKRLPPAAEAESTETESSASPSESDDSLYVPQRTRRRRDRPERTKAIPTRRGRQLSKVVGEKENAKPKPKKEMTVFRDEEPSPKAVAPEKEEPRLPQSPDGVFADSPGPMMELGQENQPAESPREDEEDDLLPVTPSVEAEMKRIDTVLSSFGDSSSDASPLVPGQTPQRANACRKGGLGVRGVGRGLSLCDVSNLSPAAYRKFPSASSRPSGARCSTPVPARKRRCTMTVDYKEPSLNAKLRRGDKFTDLQFLRSPIFKQNSSRRSSPNARKSMNSQQPFQKYNESFVGCR